ncbi:MAG: hypothetical protein JXR69_01960 [Candidatus Delongbacteria bacterium]|nr:hypothetical protein [Candidatus Delongbacteria bacterium]
MKILQFRSCLLASIFLFVFTAFSLEKATIFYKNGEILKCSVEKYEIGKFAEVIDEENNKRIITWDSIKEIVFSKDPAQKFEEKPEIMKKESKSMMDGFKYKEEVISPKEEEYIKEIQQENTGNKPTIDLDKKTGEVSVDYYQTLESDAKRRCWLEDGGMLLQKSLSVNYTYASMQMDNMGISSDSDTQFKMNGFGISMSGALKFLSPPSYEGNKNSWNAFSIKFSFTGNQTYGSIEMPWFDYGTMTTYNTEANITQITIELSPNIGYTFGIGKFLSESEWKGIMLGLYWKPNFTLSRSRMEIEEEYYEGDLTSTFNPMGIQWTLDWGDFGDLSDHLAQEAHFSINGFFLPETDDTPLLISIGIGAVWY